MLPKAFYSDPHFNHENIVKFSNRPFSDAWEMNLELIRRYNLVVGPSDLVIWLGDVALGEYEDLPEIINQLNGRKWLVRGNHDWSMVRMIRAGFDLVISEGAIDIGGAIVRLKHDPYGFNNTDHKLIHGHTHSTSRTSKYGVHVGVDAWDYYPATVDEVRKLL